MADALLSALASTILTNLNSLVLGEFANAGGLKAELNNLESTFTTIQAVLQGAEGKQWKDEAIEIWLRKLKDAAYEADDLLDEFAIHAQRPTDLKSRVRSFFSHENSVVYRRKMVHKLRSVREKLDAIAREMSKFQPKEVVIEDRGVDIPDWRKTTSLVNESEIIGREKEKEDLISMLMTSSEDLSVHAICGMGGLGKTALAQLVYNDGRVRRHFDMRIWVCVSDNFNLRRLTRDILKSIHPKLDELDPLRQLQQGLTGKKFLLILDDVWNAEFHKWDELKNAVRCGARGSTVIVTTRNEKIALMMATKHIYKIGRLSDDDSLSLFERHAFEPGSKGELVNLETIGRDIVKKCGGFPLAIKIMGSLMRLKRTEIEWLSVKKSETWELPDEESMNILPALRLSYNHLAPHLKQCFAFCSIFPKDYKMEKDKLIRLWIANGFIPCKGQMDLHDHSKEIFDELVWRSFFQDVKEDLLGNATCKMHDLLHDLAQSIMKDECKLIESNQIFEVSRMVRHLSFYRNDSDQSFPKSNNLFNDQSLHSFLWLGKGSLDQQVASYYLSGQKHLRVLDLFNSHLEKLPTSIERLKHLRYLDFSCSLIRSLPESTTSLQNLQTLNLICCSNLYKLPEGMKHMKNLMYLDITGCSSLSYMPPEMGQLTYLRKLTIFIVGKDSGHGIGELKELNLGGELSIKKLDCVKSYSDAKKANLVQKKDLKSLELSWSPKGEENNNLLEDEKLLYGLQPHSDLKKLIVSNYKGSTFPNWMMELNLVEMELVDCERCENLPPFGKLKFLKILILEGMNGVRCIGNEIFGVNEETSFPFQSLEILKFDKMSKWEEWKILDTEDGGFPSLQELYITHCPNLKSDLPKRLPFLKKLVTLPATIVDGGKGKEKTRHEYEESTQESSHQTALASTSGSSPKMTRTSEITEQAAGSPKHSHDSQLEDTSTSHDPEISIPPQEVASQTSLAISDTYEISSPKKEPSHQTFLASTSGYSPKMTRTTEITEEAAGSPKRSHDSKLEDASTSHDPEISILPQEVTSQITLASSLHDVDVQSSTEITRTVEITHQIDDEAEPVFSKDDMQYLYYSPGSLTVSDTAQVGKLPTDLHSLRIEGCKNSKPLPFKILNKNPSILHFYVIDCCFPLISFKGARSTPLKTLHIQNCRELKFPATTKMMPYFANIEHLCIASSCETLQSFPLNSFPKLEILRLWDCMNLNSLSIEKGLAQKNLEAFESLEIRDCPNFRCFPERGFSAPNLTSIIISNCKTLQFLPNQTHCLKSLRLLFISKCQGLASLPTDGLPKSLNLLCITSCDKITPKREWKLSELDALTHFEIEGGCKDIISFPEEGLLPKSLIQIRISTLPNLEYLNQNGLQQLTSLQKLEIDCCKKLLHFPEELPSSLSFLSIKGCPLLKNKLSSRIAEIPTIFVDDVEFH